MENNNLDTPRHDEAVASYTLTVEEAATLFPEAGVPKSPRTISRNCDEGTLTCTKVDTANFWKYMIDRTSIDRRIIELKNVKRLTVQHDTSSHDKMQQDASRHNEVHQDASRHTSTQQDEEHVRNLEALLKGLEIDKAVRDRSIQYLERQLAAKEAREEKFIEQLIGQSQQIGDLKRQLLLLEPGAVASSKNAFPAALAPETKSEIVEASSASEIPKVETGTQKGRTRVYNNGR